MPRIFDNIEHPLLTELQQILALSNRSDFCVGYFNLRGWKSLDSFIEIWPGGDGHQCRLLVGMQRLPQDELREVLGLVRHDRTMDNVTAQRIKTKLAEEFRAQLTIGAPSNEDENGLRRLVGQLRAKKVVVKLFLRHTLHAKLYLCHRVDPINPTVGYLGSSNLTVSGLSAQGELNVDVMDHDATEKLSKWFTSRWTDRWCIDISEELIEVIEGSWARERTVPPYHIYIKMAYHLAQEARAGLSQFRIPREFGNRMFEYQTAAVKIAAHHLNKRGGVLIGDVVGLGKTLMATAVAKILEIDQFTETLIICPRNLVPMWEDYVSEYRLIAKVLSITKAAKELASLRRFRVVILDESHNLRNRAGKRFKAIQEYIQANESKCILLSATPYNKTYIDLSSQLRLFVPEDKDLGIRPERLLRDLGETEFLRRHQCPVRSLSAFEKSDYADDWRDLMRLYMVRRTRTFIQENYAMLDPENGRKYLTFEDGTRSYFPERIPKTVKIRINEKEPNDQYAKLFAPDVVSAINALNLPRYGLGSYIAATPNAPSSTQAENKIIQDLSRAGKQLMGFCRTNLFKRLESSGEVFRQSITRHILRNYIYLHGIDQDLPLPIGTHDAGLLDSACFDEDPDDAAVTSDLFENGEAEDWKPTPIIHLRTDAEFRARAKEIYELFVAQYKSRFKWLRPNLFVPALSSELKQDANSLVSMLARTGDWRSDDDQKLAALLKLLTKTHPKEKVIIFSQFADTVRYLETELRARGVDRLAGVTGQSEDPTKTAWRFSPDSNHKRDRISAKDELRVLVATDVLSEGQNLQDASIIVNFDLPWAIIRLIQRAGRVDRIGQRSEKINCYSFLPADGVENIIRIRARVRQRLLANAEVVGTDEAFFEDDMNKQKLLDLYHEKSGILDGDGDSEVDLASYAYQIWKNATDQHPELLKTIPELPAVVYSTKNHQATDKKPSGVLVYLRTAEGNDALTWMDASGKNITENQFDILRAAECSPDDPPLPRQDAHHDLVKKAIDFVASEEQTIGGQLGRPSGARFKTYERLKRYADQIKGTLFESLQLTKAIEDLYRYPLRQSATDSLNRQLRSAATDEDLADLVVALREDDRFCIVQEEDQERENQIVCSLGLSSGGGE